MLKIGDYVEYVDFFAGPFLTVLGRGVVRGFAGGEALVRLEADVFCGEESTEFLPIECLKLAR